MAQSLSRVLLHVTFSTKGREGLIAESVRNELHAYLAGICRGQGAEAFRVGGTADHVHIACTLPRTVSVSTLVQQAKQSSSAWMKARGPIGQGFQWQAGYGAFSVGQSQLPALMRYIERQEEHHKKATFQEEFLAFLSKYGIEYDERLLWQ
jgi:REP element-mobilizing transposase RayT